MKLLMAALLTIGATTASAYTSYGDSGNEDLTSIFVIEYSKANCEDALAAAQAKLRARNKVVISAGECTGIQKANGEPAKFGAVIRYHKYL